MEDDIATPIKVYIKINQNNEIIDINSDRFIDDFTGWIKIDEGFGDRYGHAQSQYFDKLLTNDEGKYNYKFVNGNIIENTIE